MWVEEGFNLGSMPKQYVEFVSPLTEATEKLSVERAVYPKSSLDQPYQYSVRPTYKYAYPFPISATEGQRFFLNTTDTYLNNVVIETGREGILTYGIRITK
jgi:hypothetical protein